MINKKIIFSGIILLLIVKLGMSQIINSKDYVIITFESIQKNPNVEHNYYWIAPINSIENKATFNIYPLYTEEYSKDNYEKCLKGDTVDIFTTTKATNFDFRKEYLSQLELLQSIVKEKGMLVQELELSWNKQIRKKEKLNIYATPIKGEFCTCTQLAEVWGNPDLNFIAQVFMPVNSFSYKPDFWQTELGKIIQYADYSQVDFKSHFPLDIYGKNTPKAVIGIKPFETKSENEL